jgi:hypothetical protein
MKRMSINCFLTLLALTIFSIDLYAESTTKAFEIGPGTAFGTSNKRNFYVPGCHPIGVTVKYQRAGDVGTTNDVPIVIEVRHPGSTAESEGPVVASKNDNASRSEKTATFQPPQSEKSCSNPWAIRVRSASGTPAYAVTGTITVAYNSGNYAVAVENAGSVNLDSGNTVTLNLGDSNGIPQGMITITGDWYHNLGVLPIRMRFELIAPNGTVVASDSGYSRNEINPCCSGNKLKVEYRVTACIKGQWKLRVKNISDGHDAIRLKPIAMKNAHCT